MQWLRWYHGTCEDAKFRVVARKTGSSIPDIIAVWALILERASATSPRGRLDVDTDLIAATLDIQEERGAAIIAAMHKIGVLQDGRVAKWQARQFASDEDSTAAARKRRQREKSSTYENVTRDMSVSHAGVTHLSRGQKQIRSDTETNTDYHGSDTLLGSDAFYACAEERQHALKRWPNCTEEERRENVRRARRRVEENDE